MDLTRDFVKLTDRLKSAKSVEIPLQSLGTDQEAFAYGILTKGLAYVNQTHLNGTLYLVLSELLKNAEKAVLKKIYFSSNKIDPASASVADLEAFYGEYRENSANLRALARKLKRIALFQIRLEDDRLHVIVENEGTPDAREAELIGRRMAPGAVCDSLKTAASEAGPTGEGEGAGLILALLALRNAGLPGESLRFRTEGKKTVFELEVSRDVPEPGKLERIEKELLVEVESLPSFPEHINRMIELCQSDKSDARQVANEIERDPTIASQIMKLANSGGFAGGNVANLFEAVKIVGFSNISGLLLKVGAIKILEDRYDISEELKEHPVRVAFYSRMLARQYKMAAVADQAYVAGLLHDIGKIVLLAKMQNRKEYESLIAGRDRRTQINLEELNCGVSHATLGGLLARKWNFPEDLCVSIELHHTPHEASAEQERLVHVVYLANAISDFQQGKLSFFALEPDVLARFNITTDGAFEMIAANLNGAYMGAPK